VIELYEAASLYSLYHEFYNRIVETLAVSTQSASIRVRLFPDFLEAWQRRFHVAGLNFEPAFTPAHALACFFQFARAFQQIFESILGASGPAGRLRAAVWQSIFTHDLRRYWRIYYTRMGEFVTLVTGPSGSGKELVARAIARSRYLPFQERTQSFPEHSAELFHPVHIGALPATLVESELFGHRKGAFTGAIQDRRGWLDVCPPHGAVFLDEIGELTPEIQVKLLRVIETREFTAVGDTAPKRFDGKLIAATHRELPGMIARGEFREDLYYRLCSDLITTPSLAEQVRDSPAALHELVRFMARKHAGPEETTFAEEAYRWIEQNLGADYGWPGNYRELEQCVRNLIVRREYRPARRESTLQADDMFAPAREGALTAEALVQRYCTLVYAQTGSYEETGRRLGLDRRTVKSRIDRPLLERLKEQRPHFSRIR
jgi:DNA-binding NtrC family response regulator